MYDDKDTFGDDTMKYSWEKSNNYQRNRGGGNYRGGGDNYHRKTKYSDTL